MWGNVNSPLSIKSSGSEVGAEGWMEWDAVETSAVFTIGITQSKASGTGSGVYLRGKTEWDIPVHASTRAGFVKGDATASVTAVVQNGGGPPTTVNWTAVVRLG